jgi:hypothetical protein
MDIKDMTVTIKFDTYIKKILSEKVDDMLKEIREREVKTDEEMLERNKKIMKLYDGDN